MSIFTTHRTGEHRSLSGELRILQPSEYDRLLLPWLGTFAGLVLAIVCFYLEFQRRHPGSDLGSPETEVENCRRGVEPRLWVALTLLALGWISRYVADRFGGGWALAGHALALGGILVLARVMLSWGSPEKMRRRDR
ncbi:MAG TPA: hypothetical protein VFW45_09335 [Candidatus Polarisedimenticolia bacterium]|nr:hypothetical protein [Candidatus Polarisedimenticolia bacterium]